MGSSNNNIEDRKKDIDLLELAKFLYSNKKNILRFAIVGFVLGVIIAISLPKTYTTIVTLAPESQSGSVSGNIGALAAMAGINFGGTGNSEIISPELFPSLLSSTPFLTELFDVRVKDDNQHIDTTLFSYLEKNQVSPWWTSIVQVPSKFLGFFRKSNNSSKDLIVNEDKTPYIVISKSEESVLNQLRNLLVISIDKKTGIVTLSTTMQSAPISAIVADAVTRSLQGSIIKYRTSKARQDLEFSDRLYNEARDDYHKKQQNLATYTDSNMGVISAKYGTTRDRLQNEVNLAYGIYNQMAQQLQMAKIKVQDTTPVYTIIQPAVEPLLPASPNKKLIVVGLTLLFILGTSSYLLIKNYFSKY